MGDLASVRFSGGFGLDWPQAIAEGNWIAGGLARSFFELRFREVFGGRAFASRSFSGGFSLDWRNSLRKYIGSYCLGGGLGFFGSKPLKNMCLRLCSSTCGGENVNFSAQNLKKKRLVFPMFFHVFLPMFFHLWQGKREKFG